MTRRVTASVFAIAVSMLLPAGSAGAKAILKRAPTKLTLSATRAPDGTITATARLTSPNPHCLEAHRFKKLRDGYIHAIGATLAYGGPVSFGEDNEPAGADGYADPPGNGWLSATSRFGRSPLIWRAVWLGSDVVTVERRQLQSSEQERYYKSTVAAASAVDVSGDIGDRLGEAAPYFAKYFKGGQKYKVKCSEAKTTRYFIF